MDTNQFAQQFASESYTSALPLAEELRRRPIQRRAKNTVEVILTATERVLLERGYDGLSTTQVAKVAGVGIGSLYQYFCGKRELVRSLLASQSSWFEAELRRVSPTGFGPLARLLLERRRRDLLLFQALKDGPSMEPSFEALLACLGRLWPEATEVERYLSAAALVGAVDQIAQCRAELLETAELERALEALVRRLTQPAEVHRAASAAVPAGEAGVRDQGPTPSAARQELSAQAVRERI